MLLLDSFISADRTNISESDQPVDFGDSADSVGRLDSDDLVDKLDCTDTVDSRAQLSIRACPITLLTKTLT